MRRSSKPTEPAIDRSHVVEDETRAGEFVRIIGGEGVVLGGVYRIRCLATNTRTGASWLELNEVGGSKEFRAVRPDRTRPATKSELRSRSIPTKESSEQG